MQRRMSAVAGAVLSLALCGPAAAQQKIEWKQTVNTAKGLNMPKDVTADILGIEPGDTYAEAKAKLEKLLGESGYKLPPPMSDAQRAAAEMNGQSFEGPLREATIRMQFPAPGGLITASYAGQMTLIRELPGATKQTIHEGIEVKMSAPSSGQQVLGIKRSISYPTQSDQPRVSEILAGLRTKYKAEFQQVNQFTWRAQYNDGRSYLAKDPVNGCKVQYSLMGSGDVSSINPKGECDVVIQLEIQFGISQDHAQMATFYLSDNERTKANMGADFAFFDSYVRGLQNTKAAPPKL